jgi:single-strand DNA-binding protein
MNQLQVIGNLGADAEIKESNGQKFVSFKVADSQRWTDANGESHESTVWVGCIMSGDGGNLLQYLKKGTAVFVEGRMSTRIYSSEKQRAMVAGIDLSVRHVELIGAKPNDVPSRLFTPQGMMVNVSKLFFTEQVENYGCVLLDRSGNQYSVDNYGWVSRIEQQAPKAQTEQAAEPAATKTTEKRKKGGSK